MKDILGADFTNGESIKDKSINLRKPIVVSPETNLLDLLKEFRQGKSHMAFVTEEVEVLQTKLGLSRSNSVIPVNLLKVERTIIQKKPKILGIITLEDVIEEIINIDIKDEDDYDKERLENLRRQERQRKEVMKMETARNRKNYKEKLSNKIGQSFLMSFKNSYLQSGSFFNDDLNTPFLRK